MNLQFNIAEIAVTLPVWNNFHYSIPECISESVCIGKRVLVPFGIRNTIGYVVQLKHKSDVKELRNILEVVDEIPLFPENMVYLFSWLSNYYMYPMGEIIKLALPKGLGYSQMSRIYLLPKGEMAFKTKDTSSLNKEILSSLMDGSKTLGELKKK